MYALYLLQVSENIMIHLHENLGLDTPFLLYFSRLIRRTFLRLIGKVEPCAPGCKEHIYGALCSSNSILWWAITNHKPYKRLQAEMMKIRGVHIGGDMRRIGGWGKELEDWKYAVREMVRTK